MLRQYKQDATPEKVAKSVSSDSRGNSIDGKGWAGITFKHNMWMIERLNIMQNNADVLCGELDRW